MANLRKVTAAAALPLIAVGLLAAFGCGVEMLGLAPAPTMTPTIAPEQAATLAVETTPFVTGNCLNGMKIRPGEGCLYAGGESVVGKVVLSVQQDGTICREGGPVEYSGFIMDNLHLCTSGFDSDDIFGSDIAVRGNADGSWTFYLSSASTSTSAASAPQNTPIPVAEPASLSEFQDAGEVEKDSMFDGGRIPRCHVGIALPPDSFCIDEGATSASSISLMVAHLPDGAGLVLQGGGSFQAGGNIQMGWITYEKRGADRVITHLDPPSDALARVSAHPAATPRPADTPRPAATAQPTATPQPRATPRPTFTPRPTATRQPRATPRPTSTPRPTATPVPLGDPFTGEITECSGRRQDDHSLTMSATIEGRVQATREVDALSLTVEGRANGRLVSTKSLSTGRWRAGEFQNFIIRGTIPSANTLDCTVALEWETIVAPSRRPTATPRPVYTPRPTATPRPRLAPTPAPRSGSACSVGMTLRDGEYCTISIPGIVSGGNQFKIIEGGQCVLFGTSTLCTPSMNLNGFIAQRGSDGSWMIISLP